jgi:hypothetical protein
VARALLFVATVAAAAREPRAAPHAVTPTGWPWVQQREFWSS